MNEETNGFTEALEAKRLSIYKSLAAFQQECPVIHKATTGYGYTYADLPTIFKVINPLLKKNGLGFTQLIDGTEINTILFHIETGETLESKTNIPQNVKLAKMNDFQVLGSAVTYIRRYALSSMLGIVTDKDTDAGGEQKPKEVKKPTLNAAQFDLYLDAIESGATKLTIEQSKIKYSLTDEQIKTLDAI